MFRRIVELLDLRVLVTDPRERILYANPAFLREVGASLEQVRGRRPSEFVKLDMDPEQVAHINDHLARGLPVTQLLRSQDASGQVVWNRMQVLPLHDAAGELQCFVGVHENVTAAKEAEARLQHAASTDGLTGLRNRRAFDDALARGCEEAQRRAAPLSLLILDLDGFKSVNDTHGHLQGDAVLKVVADVLTRRHRRADEIFRLGGDEFAVLLPHTDAESARRIAGRLQTTLDVALGELPLGGVSVRVSLGTATLPQDGTDPQSLLHGADQRMYARKAGGKRAP